MPILLRTLFEKLKQAKKSEPLKGMEFSVGEGLTHAQRTKAESVIKKEPTVSRKLSITKEIPRLVKSTGRLVQDLFPDVTRPVRENFTPESFETRSKTQRAIEIGLRDITKGLAKSAEISVRNTVKHIDKASIISKSINPLNPTNFLLNKLVSHPDLENIQRNVIQQSSGFFNGIINAINEKNKDELKKLPKSWQEQDLKQIYKEDDIVPFLFASIVPYVGAVATAGVAGGISLATGVGGAAVGGLSAEEAKEFGAPIEVQDKVAFLTGAFTALTESGVLAMIFRRNPVLKQSLQKRLTDYLKVSTAEGAQEISQQGFGNLVAQWYYDNERELKHGLVEAGLLGALTGTSLKGSVDLINALKGKRAPIGLTIEEIGQPVKAPKKNEPVDKIEKIESARNLLDPQGQREYEIIAEMEKARAGQRIFIPEDPQARYSSSRVSIIGEKSTFPKWVPSHLRSRKLFNSVQENIKNKEIPQTQRGLELYTVVLNEMNDRLGIRSKYTEEDLATIRDNKKQFLKIQQQIAQRLLKAAEAISRPATRTETKKAIKETTTQPLSKLFKKREITLLKDKLRQQAIGSRAGLQAGKRIGKAVAELKADVKLDKRVRREQLRALREGIRMRLKTMQAGIKAGEIQARDQVMNLQEEIIALLDASKLELQDKAKFIKTIKNIQKPEQFLKQLSKIEDRIVQLERKAETRQIRKQIEKELKETKVKMQAGKPVGEFTPEIQKTLDRLRTAMKLTIEQAYQKLGENVAMSQGIIPEEIRIENEILTMRIDIETKSVSKLQQILNNIRKMKETGEAINQLKKFNDQTEVLRMKELLVNTVTGGKGLEQGVATFGRKIKPSTLKSLGHKWILDWGGLMSLLEFNISAKNAGILKKAFSTLEQDNTYKRLESQFITDFNNTIAQVYNIKNKPSRIRKKIIDLHQKNNLGEFTNAEGIKGDLIMTKDEMIKRHMELQDSTLIDSLIEGNGYTDEIIRAIETGLSTEDRAFAQAQFDMYREMYKQVNSIFRELNGVDMPFNEFYSPIRREGFQIDTSLGFGEFFVEILDRQAVSPGALKTRINSLLSLKQQGSTDVLTRHFKEMNYFTAWAKQVRLLKHVFGDTEVRTAIEQFFGKSTLNSIDNNIQDFISNGNKHARRYAGLDWARKNFTVGALMVKPVLAAKQMVSTFAYLEKLGPIEFTAGVIDFWINPIKNTKILNSESVMIKTRGEQGNIERDIRAAMESDVFRTFKKGSKIGKIAMTKQAFTDIAMLNIRLGDKGAILTGSWAMRRAALKKGKSIEQSRAEYEEFSSDTQQSADLSRLSEAQRGGSFEQIFTMFKSSPRQYLQKEVNAVRSLFQKDGFSKENIKKVARVLAVYHIFLPIIFQFISNFGGWDEDDKKDYIRAGILGSLNGLFIVGDAIDAVVRTALGMQVWDMEIPIISVVDDVNKTIKKVKQGDIDTAIFLEAIAALGQSAGIPTKQAFQLFEGIQDLLDGQTKEGIGQLLGWSEYAVGGDGKKNANSNDILNKYGIVDNNSSKSILKKYGIN